jgi:hypothetical protein
MIFIFSQIQKLCGVKNNSEYDDIETIICNDTNDYEDDSKLTYNCNLCYIFSNIFFCCKNNNCKKDR